VLKYIHEKIARKRRSITWNSRRVGQVETVVQTEVDEAQHRCVELLNRYTDSTMTPYCFLPKAIAAVNKGGIPSLSTRVPYSVKRLSYCFTLSIGVNSEFIIFIFLFSNFYLFYSVADPDPSDPYVFGPPGSGSGSISQRYGSACGSVPTCQGSATLESKQLHWIRIQDCEINADPCGSESKTLACLSIWM
jgi:hypothetical protein